MLSNQLTLCGPLLLLPLLFPSIRVFSNESALCIIFKRFRPYLESSRSSVGAAQMLIWILRQGRVLWLLLENRSEEAKSETEATRSEPLKVLRSTDCC